jgi:hypothetical protein
MSRLHLVDQIRHLFVDDDGSLPDFFIENISISEFFDIISCIEDLSAQSQFQVWNPEKDVELQLTSPSEAIKLFVDGKIESFRFPANDISIINQTIPSLGFGVYGTDCIEFDYRMGEDWTDDVIIALIALLSKFTEIAPNATIRRCKNASPPSHDSQFSDAIKEYQKD